MITLVSRSGKSTGFYNVPWIFMTVMMVFAICKIKAVLKKQESDTFVLNERAMTGILVLYVVYCTVYVSFSVFNLILGNAMNAEYT